MQNYWAFHNSKMIELRKKYDKIDRQTRNRLQEIFNRFEITADNLYSYVSKDVKKQVNSYIEEWSEKKINDEYFKVLMMTVLTKDRVTYAEILELFIYEAYIEQQMKEKDEEDSLFYTLFAFYYMEGQKEVNNTLPKEKHKKYSTFYEDLFATIIMTPNSLGYIYEDYKKSITKYNAEQILRQATISITQGKELKIDSSEFQNLIDRQQKAKLNINGDKISGAVDNTLIGMNNQAKAMGITAIQPDALVKFIAVMDEKTTKMCESLDGQIFSVRDWNEFKRYSESHQGIVKYRCRGLVTGLNLPPINDNFHFCRSTIIYVANGKEREYNIDSPYYLIKRDMLADNISNEKQELEKAYNMMTPSIQKLMETTTFEIGGSEYSRYNRKIDYLYVRKGAKADEIVHEIGHLVETKLNLLNDTRYIDIQKEMANNSIVLPTKIFEKDSYIAFNMNLVSNYQGYIYSKSFNGCFENNVIKYNLLGEVFSEGFRAYYFDNEKLKTNNRKLYNLIEEVIK